MRCAIFTLQGLNYGNRLQNYALQTVLEGLGHKVFTLRRRKVPFRSLKELGRAVVKDDYVSAFRRFDKNIFFSSAVVSGEYTSPGICEAFDCFVMGSDQIWNPSFGDNSAIGYLPMIPREKKVAYAASYGISEIIGGKEEASRSLKSILKISMRENAGSEIVEELAGIKAPVVLDPTMLLSAKSWEAVSVKPLIEMCQKRYVFKYILGNDVNGLMIEKMAQSLGFEVVDAMDRSMKLGPAEFVWLIANSALVCTDSFHASVFALLHHKPLCIFERCDNEKDMSSRFDTLCGEFNLNGIRASKEGFSLEAAMSLDWQSFEYSLSCRRKESLTWLESALADCSLSRI